MTQAFDEELWSLLAGDRVLAEEPLARHTTFRIGGPAEWLVLPESEDEVRAVVEACRRRDVPWRVLGLGSNVLAADAGVRGVVIKLAEGFSRIDVGAGGECGADGESAAGERGADGTWDADAAGVGGARDGATDAVVLTAQAGATNEAVAEAACAAGLAGYEFASGIPGTIGGAAVMNAGAYDGEFKDVAVGVRCLTPEGEVIEVPAAEAAWGYRASLMMERGYVVLGATLRLRPDDPAAIRARMDDLRRRREDKQPLEMPSAGSTFKRPEGYYAGKLIQDAGMQGRSVGGAQVSTKHAGFVVNAGDATAADVLGLIELVQSQVKSKFGVDLEPEVRLWGVN